MPDALQPVGAIHHGRLVQLRIDSRQRGDVNDGIPADVLPNIRADIERPEHVRALQPVVSLAAELADDDIDNAVIGVAERADHAHQHQYRQEMRRIGDVLNEFFIFDRPNLVDAQRQQNRQRKIEDQRFKAQQNRISNHALEIGGIEKLHKIFRQRLRPWTAHDAAHRAVVLERQDNAVHRHVAEHHKKCSHRNQHDVQLPVSIDAAADDKIAHPPVPWNDRSGFLLQAQQSFHSKVGPAAKVNCPPPYIFLHYTCFGTFC